MPTVIKFLTSACAGALLLACAGARPPAGAAAAVAPPALDTAGADGYYALGRQQHGARRHVEAERAYRQALTLAPQHINARNGLAVLHAEQGDYARAIPIWQALTADASAMTGPDAAFLFNNLAYAHALRGEHAAAIPLLEKSCVLDPLNARAWERLAASLEQGGQGERAQLMLKQARALQAHDIHRDYALAGAASPAAMARTEVTRTGAALVQVRRVPGLMPAMASPAAAPRTPPQAAAQRMEIFNGNGVTGMAAALARAVQGPAVQVLRVSNMPHFAVPRTRVEYGPEQQEAARALAERLGLAQVAPMAMPGAAGLRIVLGLDQRDPVRLRQRYLQAREVTQLSGVESLVAGLGD